MTEILTTALLTGEQVLHALLGVLNVCCHDDYSCHHFSDAANVET